MKYTTIVPILILPLFCFGCGQKLPSDLPRLYPTTLVITQEGKPLGDATITMNAEGSKWPVTGLTDANGEAKMFVNGMYEGAPEGTYKVIVNKTETEEPDLPPPPENADPQQMMLYNESIVPLMGQLKTFNRVEAVNTAFETTTLSVSIASGTDRYPLDAGKAVRVEVRQRKLN